jgi:hypothetical protein
MSSPLAVGAVSAVLRNLLDNALVNVGPVGPVKVTAVAPDVIDLEEAEPKASLNLFLYRTSLNQGWANVGLPAFDGNGNQTSHPPLGLNLHYLLTAYGFADFEAEILLGYAMHVLHEHPVLDRDSIRTALDPSPLDASILPPAFQALTAADLADQVENVTITPEPIDTEELARLWSAIQSHYRPTVAYVASVVLIEARKPARKPLPVLERDLIVEPSLLAPYPTITRVEPDDSQPAARLGEPVRLAGHHLDGTGAVARFAHRLLDEPNEIPIGASADPSGIDLTLPSGPTAEHDWPAGVYLVSVELTRPGEPRPRTSNVAAMLLAPEPQLPPTTLLRNATTRNVTVTLDVSPEVRPAQDTRLTLGGTGAPAEPHAAQTSSLTFELGDVPFGAQFVRLTVDGVDSLLIDRTTEPPTFDATQSVTVPA